MLGDEIVVILPATSYGITYFKPANSPQLLAKDFRSKIDSQASIRSTPLSAMRQFFILHADHERR